MYPSNQVVYTCLQEGKEESVYGHYLATHNVTSGMAQELNEVGVHMLATHNNSSAG